MTNLIPIAYLTETCALSENIPQKKFQSTLEMAQDDLKDILNTPLYDQIISQFSTSPKSFSTENDILYPYIKKFLAWQTNFYFQKFSNSDSTATGQREFKDENSDLLSDVKMYSFEKNIKERATFYKNALINFLRTSRINNTSSYPLWVDSCQEINDFSISAITGKSHIRTEIFRSVRYNE